MAADPEHCVLLEAPRSHTKAWPRKSHSLNCSYRSMPGRDGGKAKPLKKAKAEKGELDDDDKASSCSFPSPLTVKPLQNPDGSLPESRSLTCQKAGYVVFAGLPSQAARRSRCAQRVEGESWSKGRFCQEQGQQVERIPFFRYQALPVSRPCKVAQQGPHQPPSESVYACCFPALVQLPAGN